MERGPGLAFLLFLLTVSGLFSHPLSDQEIEYSTVSVSITFRGVVLCYFQSVTLSVLNQPEVNFVSCFSVVQLCTLKEKPNFQLNNS